MKTFAKVAVAAAVAGLGLAAHATVVDTFNLPPVGAQSLIDSSPYVAVPATTATNQIGYANTFSGSSSDIIGGYRDLFVSKIGLPDKPNSSVTLNVADGSLNYSSTSNAYGFGIVRWDGANLGNPALLPASPESAPVSANQFNSTLNLAGLSNVNLLASSSAFSLGVDYSDFGFGLALEVYTDATHWSKLLLHAITTDPDGNGTDVPYTETVAFNDFLGVPNLVKQIKTDGALLWTGSDGAADFSNVGALQGIINAVAYAPYVAASGVTTNTPIGPQTFQVATGALDVSVNLVQTVPEPESLALVGLGLLGLAATRRRQNSK